MTPRGIVASITGMAFVMSFAIANAATPLTVSCVGEPGATSITWTASFAGGVGPVALLWSNGSTSTAQTVSVAPGTYSLNIQATDASSTVATSTCSATVAQPTTPPPTDLQAKIQDLLNQIAALKAQILLLIQNANNGGTTPPPTATSTPPMGCAFGRDLEFGDEGDDVRELQRNLSSDPNIFPPGLITGFFGERTQEALKKFQEKFGIVGASGTTTGFFGPKTRGFMKAHCEEDRGNDDFSSSDSEDEHSFMSASSTVDNGGPGNGGLIPMMGGGHGRNEGGDSGNGRNGRDD